jgi:hypothetical protein
VIRKTLASAALAGALVAGVLAAPASKAAIILQDYADLPIQANQYEPIAQSFTAEDEAILFAFYFQALDVAAPNETMQLTLLAGDGTSGAQLATQTFTLSPQFQGFYDVDFSSVALTIGLRYTAVLSVPGTSPYWGVDLAFESNPYVDGRAYFTSSAMDYWNSLRDDFRFRVTPTDGTDPEPNPVPEPSSLALLALALGGLGLTARRRRR